MNNKTISTFDVLLDEYKVEIPIVQRDYAQGRQDDHAKNVRLNLLKDMRAAVLGESTVLDLSFVYGKVIDEKFIPIDGQQRLTTLFLLYLYAFRNDDSKTSLLKRFTYETRITSREFILALIENRSKVFIDGTKPSAEIEDSEWFILGWIHDPTVLSVLIMLDDIVNYFCDIDDFSMLLIGQENDPIVFKFLDMQDLGMEDNLYIKLNARGKPLTEFENFKAQIISRMISFEFAFIDEFEQNFDGKWTDLFWQKHKKDFDQTYYTFFGVLLMNQGIIQYDNRWANSIDYGKLNEEVFKKAFHTLNYLSDYPEDERSKGLIFNALSDRRTYSNRVLFHALTTYLTKAKGKNVGMLDKWIRIINNLVSNSTIDNQKLYRSAIESIDLLSDEWDNLESFFADKNRVAGFNQQQVLEEQIKAKLIMTNEEFGKAILLAEQHPYFSGQVRSALYLSKEKGDYSKEKFEYYWKLISNMFDDTKPKFGVLLRRSLLSLGDYTLDVSSFKTLCVDDSNEAANTPSLKTLFSNCGKITTELLDRLNPNVDIKRQLKDIVGNSSVEKDDWRYCFIEYSALFKWMSVSHLRLRILHNNMHMIKNKQANGYNFDLFLSALHIELKRRNMESFRDGELGTYVEHSLFVEDYTVKFNGVKFRVYDDSDKVLFVSQSKDPITETANYLCQLI